MRPSLFGLRKFILDLVFPVFCLGCGQEGDWLCAVCRQKMIFSPPICFVCKKISWPEGRTCEKCRAKTRIYALLSPFSFQDRIVRDLIHHLKYQRVRNISSVLAKLLAVYLQKHKIIFSPEMLVVPIPIHRSRRSLRGFNQAELIAEKLAEETGLKVGRGLLLKTIKNKPQADLSGEERHKNILGVFRISDNSAVRGRDFILLDDVKTTGSTLEEAARMLKEAGARRVWAITVAH